MISIEWTTELRFVIACGLGLLVGLERESTGIAKHHRMFAGIRTYTIIAIYGFGCAWLFQSKAELALPAGMLTVAALAVTGYVAKLRDGHIGWTSEISAALTFVVGALCLLADIWIPMTLGIINTILLSEKAELERSVERLDTSEFLAVLKFLLVTVIILPALPDREFTRFHLNPAKVWQIVILVSTIGFAGYLLTKKFGSRLGLRLSGLVGGIASSTAVCVAMGRIARAGEDAARDALQASLLASGIMYVRIAVLIGVLKPALLAAMGWKLGVLLAASALLCLRMPGERPGPSEHQLAGLQNPFEIRPAVLFAAVFVLLSVLTSLIRGSFGDTGVLALSAVVGVTDIDPFILSLLQGASLDAIAPMALLLAMMSNTVTKGVYFGAIARRLTMQTALRFGLLAACHIPLIVLP